MNRQSQLNNIYKNTDEDSIASEDAHSRKTEGSQIFLRAARSGNLSKVVEFANAGTEINTCNQNGLNALHLASKEGHLSVVQELLNRGADVNAATNKGNTALHIASLAGKLDIVSLLVEKGAKVNCQSTNGFTPLYMASQENHLEVVQLLLRAGAQQSLTTDDGFTPLAVALQQNHDKVVALLLENDAKGKLRLPALHISAKKGDVKSASVLLSSNIDVNQQSASGFTPLHIAAHYGNLNVGSLLIEHGAEVNFQAKNNITPLHVASKWGKLAMVKKLAESNALIDCKTRDALTPLHCAARSGHADVVDFLLSVNANFSAKTRNGLSPMHMTAQGDHVEAAHFLLLKGANVDEKTTDLLTPLHVAAHCGNVRICKLLLDRRCEVNARALNGFTPLHIACKKNRIKVVELLLRYGAIVEATTESGLTPLHVAAFMGHTSVVLLLIQQGANPNQATVRQETALHLATRSNQTDVVRALLRNGADVDARAREQQTPLHIACRLGNVEIVSVLLANGAHSDYLTKDNYTAVHIAAKEGQLEVLELLLDKGAKLDLPTKKGFTPLHVAAKYGRSQAAKLLLQRGAVPNASARNGLTPLHVATHYNNTALALLLLQNKANPHVAARNGYTPLFIAAKKNAQEMALQFLEYGAKPTTESKNGFTPLHLAAQEGHADMCTLLLQHGAKVDHASQNGLAPLHLTAQEDRVLAAEVLRLSSATLDARTKAGYTPLHTACHFGMVNMIRFLLKHGANINAKTQLGFTPLHLAAQQGHLQVVYLLLENNADPNIRNNQGYTAGHIAKKQHYLNIFEILKDITVVESWDILEETIEVAKPDTMTEAHMTDSEDEGDIITPRIPRRKNPQKNSADDNKSPRFRGTLLLPKESFRMSNSNLTLEKEMEYISKEIDEATTNEAENESQTSMTSSVPDFAATLKPSEDSISEIQIQNIEFEKSIVKEEMIESRAERIVNAEPIVSIKSNPYWKEHNNQPIERKPLVSGFLVSFLVDARGGVMCSSRHPNMRILIPPNAASGPMRITCRVLKPGKLIRPPQLNESEGLACRILEMTPRAADHKFNSPVLLELPHHAALRGREREIIVLRSDTGESWKEHSVESSDAAVQKALGSNFGENLESAEELQKRRVVRVLTNDLPAYIVLISRIRQENAFIGAESDVISSTVVSQVQAVFPDNALQKKIRVGLQVHPVTAENVARKLGNRVAVSPIVTIEPRRRKFHKPITLTIPLPRPATRGMTNPGESPTLRLLCSITGGTSAATWEDITGSTPLSYVKDCVSFTTTVSARFWLMDCPNTSEAADMASRLYQESVVVPYMASVVMFCKRDTAEEAEIRTFCVSDGKVEKTLENHLGFEIKAQSPLLEVLQDRSIFLGSIGNLQPILKSGDQLSFNFKVFQENRLAFHVRLRESELPASGKFAFLTESPSSNEKNQPSSSPLTVLEVVLPDLRIEKEKDTMSSSEVDMVRESESMQISLISQANSASDENIVPKKDSRRNVKRRPTSEERRKTEQEKAKGIQEITNLLDMSDHEGALHAASLRKEDPTAYQPTESTITSVSRSSPPPLDNEIFKKITPSVSAEQKLIEKDVRKETLSGFDLLSGISLKNSQKCDDMEKTLPSSSNNFDELKISEKESKVTDVLLVTASPTDSKPAKRYTIVVKDPKVSQDRPITVSTSDSKPAENIDVEIKKTKVTEDQPVAASSIDLKPAEIVVKDQKLSHNLPMAAIPIDPKPAKRYTVLVKDPKVSQNLPAAVSTTDPKPDEKIEVEIKESKGTENLPVAASPIDPKPAKRYTVVVKDAKVSQNLPAAVSTTDPKPGEKIGVEIKESKGTENLLVAISPIDPKPVERYTVVVKNPKVSQDLPAEINSTDPKPGEKIEEVSEKSVKSNVDEKSSRKDYVPASVVASQSPQPSVTIVQEKAAQQNVSMTKYVSSDVEESSDED